MALPVTDAMVDRAAARLAEGGWRFTLRQLYYASCAEAEIPRTNATSNGQIAVGVLLLLVGLILIGIRPVFIALTALGVVLIVLGVVQRVAAKPPAGRVLVM